VVRAMRISKIAITPVAFADPPLLNSVGVHEPFALRAVIEIATDDGLVGLGETYADEKHLDALRAAAVVIEGAAEDRGRRHGRAVRLPRRRDPRSRRARPRRRARPGRPRPEARTVPELVI